MGLLDKIDLQLLLQLRYELFQTLPPAVRSIVCILLQQLLDLCGVDGSEGALGGLVRGRSRGRTCRSCCICWRPGGSRGSWRGGDTLPGSDSLEGVEVEGEEPNLSSLSLWIVSPFWCFNERETPPPDWEIGFYMKQPGKEEEATIPLPIGLWSWSVVA